MADFNNDLAATLAYLGGAFGAGFTAGFAASRVIGLFAAKPKTTREPDEPKISHGVLKDPSNAAIWERRPPVNAVPPRSVANGGKPIICVANMKGGVGKTTLSANLAAYFAMKHDKSVLLIDFDYQGSLTTMCLSAAGITTLSQKSQALIRDTAPGDALNMPVNLRPAMPKVDIFTSYYDLAAIETDQMVAWLTGALPDKRFYLSHILQSTEFQSRYDVVIIDAPPRFTTSSINALCASTHVLIPTKMDPLSTEAVTYFAKDIERMRGTLFPNLRVLGVVPTMTNEEGLSTREDRTRVRLMTSLRAVLGNADIDLQEAHVPSRTIIEEVAGTGIAYLLPGRPGREPKRIFDRLGDAIVARL